MQDPSRHTNRLQPATLGITPKRAFITGPHAIRMHGRASINRIQNRRHNGRFPPPLNASHRMLAFDENQIRRPHRLPMKHRRHIARGNQYTRQMRSQTRRLISRNNLFHKRTITENNHRHCSRKTIQPPAINLPRRINRRLTPNYHRIVHLVGRRYMKLTTIRTISRITNIKIRSHRK